MKNREPVNDNSAVKTQLPQSSALAAGGTFRGPYRSRAPSSQAFASNHQQRSDKSDKGSKRRTVPH